LKSIYHELRRSVAYVRVEAIDGTESIGTAFHIGQGYFVTAKHVVHDKNIIDIVITQPTRILTENFAAPLNESERPKILRLSMLPAVSGNKVDDVAVFRVNDYGDIPAIRLSERCDMNLSEDMVMLTNVLTVGYPSIPHIPQPFQVAMEAKINALITTRESDYLSYVVFAETGSGLGGAPLINSDGEVIGLATDRLALDSKTDGRGFMGFISITAAADLALKSGWAPDMREYYGDIATVAHIKLALTSTAKLNLHACELTIYVYDDDHDFYFEVICANEEHRNIAIKAFSSICPLKDKNIEDHHSDSRVFANGEIVGNPSRGSLQRAGKAARDRLCAIGYSVIRERYSERDYTP
jgi:hypothetical protein